MVRLGVFGKDWRGEWVGDGPEREDETSSFQAFHVDSF
jgi:hypothetical protein